MALIFWKCILKSYKIFHLCNWLSNLNTPLKGDKSSSLGGLIRHLNQSVFETQSSFQLVSKYYQLWVHQVISYVLS